MKRKKPRVKPGASYFVAISAAEGVAAEMAVAFLSKVVVWPPPEATTGRFRFESVRDHVL